MTAPRSASMTYRAIRFRILEQRSAVLPSDAPQLLVAMNAIADSPTQFTLDDAERLLIGWRDSPERYQHGSVF